MKCNDKNCTDHDNKQGCAYNACPYDLSDVQLSEYAKRKKRSLLRLDAKYRELFEEVLVNYVYLAEIRDIFRKQFDEISKNKL